MTTHLDVLVNLPKRIVVRDSDRLFFGTFPFKVVFRDNLRDRMCGLYDPSLGHYHNKIIRDREASRRSRLTHEIKKKFTGKSIRVYSPYMSNEFSVFFEDPTDVLAACNDDKMGAVKVYCLPVPVPKEELKSHRKIKPLVRKDLFWRRYRYRIVFKSQDSEKVDVFRDNYLKQHEETGEMMYSFDISRTLYFDNPKFLSFITMGVGNHISYIHKIILVSEITDGNESYAGSQAD